MPHKRTPAKKVSAATKKAVTTKLTGIANARAKGGKALAKGLEKRKAAASKTASPAARANARKKMAAKLGATKLPTRHTSPPNPKYKR